jgi:peroxiredoxin
VKIDPENDIILKTIRDQVEPTEEQMAQIIRLYTGLRQKHLQMARETVLELRRLRRAQEQAGQPDPDRADEEEAGEPSESGRARREAQRTAYNRRIEEKMKPFNVRFLADCRALLDESQREAWDKCAAQLDLTQGGTRSTPEQLRWLEPQRGPDVGAEAPDFELMDLEGNTVSLKSLRGKPVVLRFGSYTSPNFRQKAQEFESLGQMYGDKIHWLIVYTFEVHASDGNWVSFRNRQAGIEIPQHKTIEERIQCAGMARDKLEISAHLLVDDFDDSVTHLYSGHPNRAYVIDARGTIVSKQVWSSVAKTRAVLEALPAGPAGAEAAETSDAAPETPGAGASGSPDKD